MQRVVANFDLFCDYGTIFSHAENAVGTLKKSSACWSGVASGRGVAGHSTVLTAASETTGCNLIHTDGGGIGKTELE